MDIEVIGGGTHKARKSYVCDMCGRRIEVGERYEQTFCKDIDSSKTITYRLHKRCGEIVGKFNRMYGAIPDDLSFRQVAAWVREDYCSHCHLCGGTECNGDIFTCKGF